jgi:hypothetical protein
MPKKIIDQYTGRADLTGFQKWKLRHPEAYKASVRNANIKALDYHCDYERQRRKKVKQMEADKRNISAGISIKQQNTLSTARRNEIVSLHKRGKELGSIAIWTNLPMSVINSVIASHNPA